MIVPTVRIIPVDDDSRLLPFVGLLKPIDNVDQKQLLIEGGRVIGMAVLSAPCLQEAHGRHVAAIDRNPEIGEIVLVIGLIGLADHGCRCRRQMMRIRSRKVVLKWIVMRAVSSLEAVADGGGLESAHHRSDARRRGWFKSTLEPTPRQTVLAQQIPHILTTHSDSRSRFGAAVVIERIRIADYGGSWARRDDVSVHSVI